MSAPPGGYFGFAYWPFGIVPNADGTLVWADRADLKRQIRQLGRSFGRHNAVSLHLVWADFGAGKTHTLLFLKQQAERGELGSVWPLYSALPKGCRSFLDIYRAIVRAIPRQLLEAAYRTASVMVSRERLTSELAAIWPSLPRCLSAIGMGSEDQATVALAWLQAESGLTARRLQDLSIHGRISSTDDAVLALCGIVRLFNLAGHKRVVLMIDEFQRVEVLRRQQQDDINAGLHGFFNACRQGLSLLLSFSFGSEENIRHFLNAELLSRAHPLRISIPKMTTEDGVIFLNEIMASARGGEDRGLVDSGVVHRLVEGVSALFELTPRRLLKAAGFLFELAESDLEDGAITNVTASYVDSILARGDLSRVDDVEEEEA